MYSLNNVGGMDDKIGHIIVLSLVFLAILPLSTSYIDCRISCRRCHEKTEHVSILEVYCAMCEECKQRRREKTMGRTKTIGPQHTIHVSQTSMSPVASYKYHTTNYIPRTHSTKQQGPQEAYTPDALRSLVDAGNLVQLANDYDDQDYMEMAPAIQMHPQQMAGAQMGAAPMVGAPMVGAPIVAAPMAVGAMASGPVYMQAPQPIGIFPPNCPTPPPCSESEEEIEATPQRLRQTSHITTTTTVTTTTTTTTTAPTTTTTTPTTTTSTTTTTTTRPSMKKLKRRVPVMVQQAVPQMMAPMLAPLMAHIMAPIMPHPCMPAVPCSGSSHKKKPLHQTLNEAQSDPVASPVKLADEPPPSTSNPDYQYVYIGIPKSAMRS